MRCPTTLAVRHDRRPEKLDLPSAPVDPHDRHCRTEGCRTEDDGRRGGASEQGKFAAIHSARATQGSGRDLHSAALSPGSRSCALPVAGGGELGHAGVCPLFRSAITFSARRALAAGIRRSTCSAAEAVYFERRDDQPAPDPARCFDCPVDPAPAKVEIVIEVWLNNTPSPCPKRTRSRKDSADFPGLLLRASQGARRPRQDGSVRWQHGRQSRRHEERPVRQWTWNQNPGVRRRGLRRSAVELWHARTRAITHRTEGAQNKVLVRRMETGRRDCRIT